MGKTGQLKH